MTPDVAPDGNLAVLAVVALIVVAAFIGLLWFESRNPTH